MRIVYTEKNVDDKMISNDVFVCACVVCVCTLDDRRSKKKIDRKNRPRLFVRLE